LKTIIANTVAAIPGRKKTYLHPRLININGAIHAISALPIWCDVFHNAHFVPISEGLYQCVKSLMHGGAPIDWKQKFNDQKIVKAGMIELNPMQIFMNAEKRRPTVMTYRALSLSVITPKKHFPRPYNTDADEMTMPMSDFVISSSLQIAGMAIGKF
jgi:hypothetical protein